MVATRSVDVLIVGGGIAGATMAGVLARAGLGVLVVEREAQFRDRIRGESTWPYGVVAAHRAGVSDLFDATSVELSGTRIYQNRQHLGTYEWSTDSLEGAPTKSCLHPAMQE